MYRAQEWFFYNRRILLKIVYQNGNVVTDCSERPLTTEEIKKVSKRL